MSTETVRLIRDGRGGGGMEVGGEGIYTYRYTVTTRMTSVLRWAARRAILMFHNCEGQSHKTVSMDHNFWRERRAEADLNWGPSTYQPNALPLGNPGSFGVRCAFIEISLADRSLCFHFRRRRSRRMFRAPVMQLFTPINNNNGYFERQPVMVLSA